MDADVKYEPNWESLAQYRVPEWFRDAKFGIWAHWGPQCEPERGDWYARGMYQEGTERYLEHMAQYGHPSEFGFKDVIHAWKAERWDPESLVALYKRAGAEYFVAMANHHDNLDLWDSAYQPWNSTVVGPKRNVIAEWAQAAKNQGLRFGVSVHCSHAWSWLEPAQGADKEGPYAGIPYDGKLTKADGLGTWWEGLDPQDLYAQDHAPTPMANEMFSVIHYWEWGNGYPAPSDAYCEKFLNRTLDLVDRYKPDLVYFDDTVLPLYPVSDVGLRFAAHYYNANPDAVMNGKVLSDQQKKTMVWDIERGASDAIEPLPWQTCTCLGDWHYKQKIYDEDGYKTAKDVIHMLADVVSKNGNLLLSVPLRGDGTPDEKEIAVVEGIAEWMAVNREAIVGTRPWKISGEGPASASAKPLSAQGFNEGTGIPFTAQDIRFTQKGSTIYAIVLGKPAGTVRITSLGSSRSVSDRSILSVRLLGRNGPVSFRQEEDSLELDVPPDAPDQVATVFAIRTARQPLGSLVRRLGHRNWVAIVDAAFPELVSPGVMTLYEERPEAFISSLLQAKHIRFEAFVDSELDYVEEADAPGIDAYRFRLAGLLGGATPSKLPHEQIIEMLNEAAKTFRVVVVKTDVLLPYTSLFLRLDCGYWDADAEARLRKRIAENDHA